MNKDDTFCRYRDNVLTVTCWPGDCEACGWNPKEETRRKTILRYREEAHLLKGQGPLIVKGERNA